jgi:hypothetical protein
VDPFEVELDRRETSGVMGDIELVKAGIVELRVATTGGAGRGRLGLETGADVVETFETVVVDDVKGEPASAAAELTVRRPVDQACGYRKPAV